jgi:hypothetical protein
MPSIRDDREAVFTSFGFVLPGLRLIRLKILRCQDMLIRSPGLGGIFRLCDLLCDLIPWHLILHIGDFSPSLLYFVIGSHFYGLAAVQRAGTDHESFRIWKEKYDPK